MVRPTNVKLWSRDDRIQYSQVGQDDKCKNFLVNIIERAFEDLYSLNPKNEQESARQFFSKMHGKDRDQWHPIFDWCCQHLEWDPQLISDAIFAKAIEIKALKELEQVSSPFKYLRKNG